MNFELEIRPNYPSKTPEGEMNLTGVARAFFEDLNAVAPKLNVLSRSWNESTQEKYMADYSERLLPQLGDRAVSSYTDVEIEGYLDEFFQKTDYSPKRKEHFQYLTYLLFAVAEELKIAQNVLWGSEMGIEEDDEGKGGRLKKSLTPEEEVAIWKMLSKPPEQMSGQEVGLIMMALGGVRNNEACGTNYSSLGFLAEHPEVCTLRIFQTTQVHSNELKAGGKTKNANRQIPLMDLLSHLLIKRYEYLKALVDTGGYALPEGMKDIGDLPIVCYGKEYGRRCQSTDLSLAGKQLFRKVGIREKDVQKLNVFLRSDDYLEEEIPEELRIKDATTYLFRRNFVTHLTLLNFSPAEIEYYVGHAIEDGYEPRNSFVNEDKQMKMSDKLKWHPLNRMVVGVESVWEEPEHLNCEPAGTLRISKPKGSVIGIQIFAREPADEVQIELKGTIGPKVRTIPNGTRYDRQVDVREWVYGRYCSVERSSMKKYE